MPTVADLLREAREKRKISVSDLAEITKIRSDHIRALESGEYNVFSAPVYIRGFVRTLCGQLRLNTAEVMSVLDDELSQSRKFREPPKLTGESKGILDFLMLQLSKVNWRIFLPLSILAVLVLALVIGYRTWSIQKTRDPLRDLGPGLYKPPALPGGDTLPLVSTNELRR